MPATSSVRDFLLGDEWQQRFDDFVLNDGSKLARKRRVNSLTWSASEDGGGILSARVQDLEGEFYEVEVSLWEESAEAWDLDASCGCPYAHSCQHAAATLLAAGKSSILDRLLKGGTANVGIGSPAATSPRKTKNRPVPTLRTKPTFHLEVQVEPANSRPVQLLLQSLRASNRDEWLVARPFARYGGYRGRISRNRARSAR